MTSKHTMSGVTTKLRKLLQEMPNTGRGIIWQRSNGLDGERLEVFGSVATALKYILDNADDVVAALAPSEAEPVAWRRELTVTTTTKERLPDDFTDNADLAELWRGHPQTISVKALYDHPDSSSDAVRITDEMVEKAARALSRFGKSFPTIDDEIEWVDTKWPRYKDEARTALIAALKGEVKK